MTNLPDESELEGNLSKIEHDPFEATDEDVPTPEFDDMDADLTDVDVEEN